jgi:uncharacterized membrane protein YeaQ/YmgE (transglycosylase-associated protein family)
MALEPGGMLAWLFVGAIAGWLAGQVMSGGGYGILGDVIVGLIGAFIGGSLFSAMMPNPATGLLGSILVAFIGSLVFVGFLRILSPRRTGH